MGIRQGKQFKRNGEVRPRPQWPKEEQLQRNRVGINASLNRKFKKVKNKRLINQSFNRFNRLFKLASHFIYILDWNLLFLIDKTISHSIMSIKEEQISL
jgi:hypothetical protein